MKICKLKQACFVVTLLGLSNIASAYNLCDNDVKIPIFPARIDEITTITGYECKDNRMTGKYTIADPASEIIRNNTYSFTQSVREDRCSNLQYGLTLKMIFSDSKGVITTIYCD
jgi:hypothetical protein